MFKLHSLACRFPVFPAPLTEETVFSPLYIVASFMTDYLTIVSGLFLGFISCSVCPFLCQYHIVLITVGLYYSLKSGSMLLYTFYFNQIGSLLLQTLFQHNCVLLYIWLEVVSKTF